MTEPTDETERPNLANVTDFGKPLRAWGRDWIVTERTYDESDKSLEVHIFTTLEGDADADGVTALTDLLTRLHLRLEQIEKKEQSSLSGVGRRLRRLTAPWVVGDKDTGKRIDVDLNGSDPRVVAELIKKHLARGSEA